MFVCFWCRIILATRMAIHCNDVSMQDQGHAHLCSMPQVWIAGLGEVHQGCICQSHLNAHHLQMHKAGNTIMFLLSCHPLSRQWHLAGASMHMPNSTWYMPI